MQTPSPEQKKGINAIRSNQFETPIAQILVAFAEALAYSGQRVANREITADRFDAISSRLIKAVNKVAKARNTCQPSLYRRVTIF